MDVAERQGFEPWVELPPQRFFRLVGFAEANETISNYLFNLYWSIKWMWRRGRDSNPGWSYPHNGFSDSSDSLRRTRPFLIIFSIYIGRLNGCGGEAGIRTLGGVTPTTVFPTRRIR